VYGEDGTVLHDETWNTSYRGEYRIIRYGTKPKPKEPKKESGKKDPKKPGGETDEPPVEDPAATTTAPASAARP
jgi:hypothetical protein